MIGAGLQKKRMLSFFIVASIPFVLLSIFRGLVGVDSAVYEQSIDFIKANQGLSLIFEPGFELLILFLTEISADTKLLMMMITTIIVVVLYIGIIKIDRKPILFSSIIIPYFFLDMSMNGLRYGLAFSIVTLGAAYLISGRRKLFFMLLVLAGTIQISSLLLGLILLMLIERRYIYIVYSVCFLLVSSIVFSEYLSVKVGTVSELEGVGLFSGVVPLLISFFSLLIFFSDRRLRSQILAPLCFLLVLVFVSFVYAKFNYAGVRIQLLVLYLIHLYVTCYMRILGIRFNYRNFFLLMLLGIVAATFRLKNFSDESGVGLAPFAPYHFYWERN